MKDACDHDPRPSVGSREDQPHMHRGQKKVYSCEYVKRSLFLYYYLLVIVLFSIQTTVNLLFPTPYLLMIYFILLTNQNWGKKNHIKYDLEN